MAGLTNFLTPRISSNGFIAAVSGAVLGVNFFLRLGPGTGPGSLISPLVAVDPLATIALSEFSYTTHLR